MSNDAPKPLKQLLGWAQKALGKAEAPAPAPAAPALPPAAAPARPATGTLPPPTPPRAPAARQTGSLSSGSSTLSLSAHARALPRASATGDLSTPPTAGASPADAGTGETPEAASKRRLGVIMAFMKAPESDPAFKNKPLMYRILSEERTYQQEQILQHQEALRFADPEDEAAYAQLEAALATAQKRQAQLFTLLKELTGKRGKTGGTGFISTDQLPPL